MSYFEIAKSFFQLLKQCSIFCFKQKIDIKDSDIGCHIKVAAAFSSEAHLPDELPSSDNRDVTNINWTDRAISEDILSSDFQVEINAESYFNNHQRDLARGSFHKVQAVRWDHDESDWSIEEIASELVADEDLWKLLESNHLASDLSCQPWYAIQRLQEFALQRHWLAAAAALHKASRQSVPLSTREQAAIEHVLNIAGKFTRHQPDVKVLRSVLLGAQKQEGGLGYLLCSPLFKDSAAASVEINEQPSLLKKQPSRTKLLKQKQVNSSVIRVRNVASERSWLSPKSSRALEKLCDRTKTLDRSEKNALNYLLDRCANISDLTYDAEVLRKEFLK